MRFNLPRLAALVLSFLIAASAFGQTSVTLQQGLNGYAGTTDTHSFGDIPNGNFGNRTDWVIGWDPANYMPLMRFAIFASEGGPVPNGATITSATLSLNKTAGTAFTVGVKRMLRSWNELQADWVNAATGTAWQAAGAQGANDVAATVEGSGTIGDASGWYDIDVTPSVQAFAAGASNFGWRFSRTSGANTNRTFVARDNATQTLRPKLTITYTISSGTTVTLMQGLNGYTGTTDAWLWGPTDTNRGTDELPIRTEATDSAVIRFAIFAAEGGPVPNGATITSATLSLYKWNGPDTVVKASRLLKSWNESQVTWFHTATGVTWTSAGANGSDTDYVAIADGQGSIGNAATDGCNTTGPFPAACWLDINVTSGVQAFAANPAGNFGWKLATVSSSVPGNYKNFNSKENNPFPTLRPKLTITYNGGSQSGVPSAALSANPTSGTQAPLNVTFNASGSTDGGSPITNLRLQFGDGTEVNWADKNQAQLHTYTGSGQYVATLTVTNANGDSNPNATQTINIGSTGEFPSSKAAIPATGAGNGETRATFHSMSLYWNPVDFSDANPPSGSQIFVRYRKATEDPAAPGFVWKQGWPLWYDVRNSTAGWGTLPYTFRARGSVVYLTPGTKYIFELGAGTDYASANFTHYLAGTTRSETFAEAGSATVIPSQSTVYPITIGGDPVAQTYKVYTGWNGTSMNVVNRGGANSDLDFGPDNSYAIVVKASYVIVRRVKAMGSATAGIYIAPNVTNVVIEDSEVTDWAWHPNANQTAPNWGTQGRNEAGGIMLGGNNSNIVVQRNKIYDPHLGNNPWDGGNAHWVADIHPLGPMGISIQQAGQQNVIRYNEIYSTIADKMHWMLDGIGGGENFSDKGVPGSDSDIYHNYIRNVMDDGIEAEGGGLNVRVWGNYIDHSGTGVSTTIAHLGPIYVFRNVSNRLRKYYYQVVMKGNPPRIPDNGIPEPDDDFFDRGEAFKAYGAARDSTSSPWWGGGRKYFFHNTLLQQPRDTYSPLQRFGDLGAGGGITGAGSGQGLRETWSRNNIFDTYRPQSNGDNLGGTSSAISLGAGGTDTNNFGFDLYAGASGAPDPGGVLGRPTFKTGHGWSGFPRLTAEPGGPTDPNYGSGFAVGTGNFQMNTGSLGLNAGTPLPNFSFDIDNPPFARKSGVEVNGNPDMGAHDSASGETMKFGINAGQP